MRLGAPGFLWFLICLVLGGLAVAGQFTFIQYVTPYRFWLAVAADEWLRGITMWLRWKSLAWARKSLVEPEPEAAPVALGG